MAQVQSLVRGLRSHRLCRVSKIKNLLNAKKGGGGRKLNPNVDIRKIIKIKVEIKRIENFKMEKSIKSEAGTLKR